MTEIAHASFVSQPINTSRRSWSLAMMLGAGIGITALTLAHPSSTRQFTWPWILVLQTVWLAPLAALGLSLSAGQNWRWPDRWCLAGLLSLAGGTLISAGLSPFAAASLPRVWPTLAGVAAFLWLHDWLSDGAQAPARLDRLARSLAVFGAVLALTSLVGWLRRNTGWNGSVRHDFPFGHSIQLAGALLFVLPWMLAAAWRESGIRRGAWLVATAVALAMLLATGSRSAALAAGGVGVAAGVWAVRRTSWSKPTQGLLALAVLAVAALAVLANPRLRELALHGAWSDLARESNTQRSAMIAAGLIMGTDRPLGGGGPGTVPLLYPQVRHRLAGGVDNVLQLHNTPVQLWATLGVFALPPLLLWPAMVALRTLRLARQPSLPAPAIAAAASLVTYGLFALTDHQLDLPALNALLVLNAVVLLHFNGPAWPRPLSRRLYLGSIGIAGLALTAPLWFTLRDLAARYRYDQFLILLGNDRTADALGRLESAARFAPHDPYYRHQLAEVLLKQRGETSNPAVRSQLLKQVYTQLWDSLQTGTFTEYAHFNLGWLALERGDPLFAARHFRDALHEAPHRRGAYFGLGLALRSLGSKREADAVRAFALEWLNDPVASTAPLWEWPDFAPLRPQVEAEALRLLAEREPAHPAAPFLRDLWRWWAQGGPPPVTGYNPESAAFVHTLTALQNGSPLPADAAPYAWGRLLQAWRSPDPAAAFAALTPRQPGLAAALTRRTARHLPPDVRGFLAAGLENESVLLANERPTRTGYGVLALHPDGPVLTDLYVRQQHRLVSEFASTLFPPKGWIPAAELLARLPPTP